MTDIINNLEKVIHACEDIQAAIETIKKANGILIEDVKLRLENIENTTGKNKTIIPESIPVRYSRTNIVTTIHAIRDADKLFRPINVNIVPPLMRVESFLFLLVAYILDCNQCSATEDVIVDIIKTHYHIIPTELVCAKGLVASGYIFYANAIRDADMVTHVLLTNAGLHYTYLLNATHDIYNGD